ncbi:TIGR01777 family oxidoreductase [Mangrovibacterium sp.]|uniref:TIGR01777 family oxidoreductase n=1 Tax=Mangrovibacterium sp. TaxID=1961364 RepID=UPI0035669766
MRICITGASGYLGKRLSKSLIKKGHEISSIDRSLLYGDATVLSQHISGADVVINLAGAPIMQRWTSITKQVIYASRVDTTLNLSDAIRQLPVGNRPRTFISASATGLYQSGITHDESSTLMDQGFTGTVVRDWEKASESLPETMRRVIFRIGVVLGKNAQTIKQLLPVFKCGLGGKIGSGKQAFSFIHINDLVSAFEFAISNPELQGIYNLVAPTPTTNTEFTQTLAQRLKRPAIIPVPAFALKLLYGEASHLILSGPKVYPTRLTEAGFVFQYPTIQKALEEIV